MFLFPPWKPARWEGFLCLPAPELPLGELCPHPAGRDPPAPPRREDGAQGPCWDSGSLCPTWHRWMRLWLQSITAGRPVIITGAQQLITVVAKFFPPHFPSVHVMVKGLPSAPPALEIQLQQPVFVPSRRNELRFHSLHLHLPGPCSWGHGSASSPRYRPA